jgi:hypothetical protein
MRRRTWVVVATSAILLFGLATGSTSASTPLRTSTFEFDPDHTGIVAAAWVRNLGLPAADGHGRAGLLLSKNGPTATNASAGVVIHGAAGMALTELGFDVRAGGHCGAGAPRFNVVTSDDVTHFVGCSAGIHTASAPAQGWQRVRFTGADAFPPFTATQMVKSLSIVFDEGTDTGPDFSGLVVLDHIDVNGTLISGPNRAKHREHDDHDDDNDHHDNDHNDDD